MGSVAPFSGFSEIWKLGIKVNFGKQFLFVAFSYPFFQLCSAILCGDFYLFNYSHMILRGGRVQKNPCDFLCTNTSCGTALIGCLCLCDQKLTEEF